MAIFEKPSNPADSDAPQSTTDSLVFHCPLNYCIANSSGLSNGEGQAEVCLYKEILVIRPDFGETLTVPFREIITVKMADYRLVLTLISGEQLTLAGLGYQYENLGRYLNRLRNEILLHDLLMTEKIKQSGFAGLCEISHPSQRISYRGPAELRLYETGLAFLPEFMEPLRFPYSEFLTVTPDDYSLTIVTEGQYQLKIMQMGTFFHPFLRDLNAALQDLSQKTQNTIQQLLPRFDQAMIRQAAFYMRDGKAARRKDLDSVSPLIWAALEEKICSSELGPGYRYLVSLASTDLISIGYKRGLLGDLGGDYLWFLVPIASDDPRLPGNALALEAFTVADSRTEEAEIPAADMESSPVGVPGGGGRATYFFRIMDREQYAKQNDPALLLRRISELITAVNHCMIAINFRREPIYLPDSRLKESRYQHDYYAVQSIPELRELRERFIGRIIHRNPAQWQRDVTDLLNFNVSVSDNATRWKN